MFDEQKYLRVVGESDRGDVYKHLVKDSVELCARANKQL